MYTSAGSSRPKLMFCSEAYHTIAASSHLAPDPDAHLCPGQMIRIESRGWIGMRMYTHHAVADYDRHRGAAFIFPKHQNVR